MFANLTLFTWLSNMNDHWEVRGKKRSFVVSKCSAGLIASRRLMHAMPRMGLYLCIDSHGHFPDVGFSEISSATMADGHAETCHPGHV